MVSLYAKVHIPNISNEYLPLLEIDFKQNVTSLKAKISVKIQHHPSSFDIFYNGQLMKEEQILLGIIRPKSIVHCFGRFKIIQAQKFNTNFDSEQMRANIQELFTVISNIQISVSSRVNVLHKVLAEYPEFRRNMGAQALIRDSVLFSTLDQLDVIRNISAHYPIICIAAGFIVDTIKKELASTELSADSTNSSEEDYSVAPSSSGTNQNADRIRRLSTLLDSENNQFSSSSSSEHQNPSPAISRQQLQAALFIARQNASTVFANNPLSATEEIQRTQGTRRTSTENADSTIAQDMDTDTDIPHTVPTTNASRSNMNNIQVPSAYRDHQYIDQLRIMLQMGFIDCDENITYLNMSSGNVEIAIDLLMGSMT